MQPPPPRFARRLLRFLIDQHDHDTLFGDIEEMYALRLKQDGAKRTFFWYWIQILRLAPASLRNTLSRRVYLMKSQIKLAFRTIKRQKGYSFINIFGLALGMACCILIIFYILTETGYDRFHHHAERIVRIRTNFKMGDRPLDIPKASPLMAQTLTEDFPEIEKAAFLDRRGNTQVAYKEEHFMEDGIINASADIFKVFTFPMLKGDPDSALSKPGSVVLCESIAKKYFKDTEPLGQNLRFDGREDLVVTGVIEDVPLNSHFDFTAICSYDMQRFKRRQGIRAWFYLNYYTYLLLKEDVKPAFLQEKLPGFVENHLGSMLSAAGAEVDLSLQPLTRIHLHSHLQQELSGNGNILYIYIFSTAALIILLVACLNFVNLSTARSANRAKEVGVRKVLGGDRRSMIFQFLGESLLFSGLAMGLAFVIVEILLPFFNWLSGLELSRDYFALPWLIPGLLALTILVGAAAGFYPAFYLSSFQPLHVLSGRLKTGAANSLFRRVLVTAQFTLSIILILSSLVVFRQLRYMKNTDLGFDSSQVVVIPFNQSHMLHSLDAYKSEIAQYIGVLGASASSHVPGQDTYKNPYLPEGFVLEDIQWMGEFTMDPDFLKVMSMRLAAGQNFSPPSTEKGNPGVMINETAARLFGWEDPVGRAIWTGTGSGLGTKHTVVGVIGDFHITSVKRAIEPLIIFNGTEHTGTLSVKLRQENIQETLAYLEERWLAVAPSHPFDYFFLEEGFDRQYQSDERMGRIFSSFTVLAIFIACLGLFGLASYLAEQYKREIGIRKILGASTQGITVYLTKEFVKWVVLANLLAWPVAYFVANQWLQSFAYRTHFEGGLFFLTAALSLCAAFLTVGYQTLRAARANPAEALRHE